jgi:hypothetical protein
MSDLSTGLQVAEGQLESFGRALVERFGLLNFWTAVLFAGVVVLDRALSRRARASLRIALYAPVGLVERLVPCRSLDLQVVITADRARCDAGCAEVLERDRAPRLVVDEELLAGNTRPFQ